MQDRALVFLQTFEKLTPRDKRKMDLAMLHPQAAEMKCSYTFEIYFTFRPSEVQFHRGKFNITKHCVLEVFANVG